MAVGDPDIAPIDEYTQAFMTEMHERAAARLTALHAALEDAMVREACARILLLRLICTIVREPAGDTIASVAALAERPDRRRRWSPGSSRRRPPRPTCTS